MASFSNVVDTFTSLGSEAVIIFFALSGYWVGGAIIKKMRQGSFIWSEYASARLTRLWLVLIPALVLTGLLDMLGAQIFPHAQVYTSPHFYAGIPPHPSHSPLAFLGNFAFLQGLHVPIFGTNNPLWSLAYEFWYYVLFPALLVAFWPRQSWKRRTFGAALAAASIIISGFDVMQLFPAWLVGAIIASQKDRVVAALSRLTPRLLGSLRLLSLVAMVGTAVFVHEVFLPLRLGATLLAIVTAVVIALFAADVKWAGAPGRVLGWASWTAHSSYSLYASHMPIVVFMAAMLVPSFAGRWAFNFWSVMSGLGVVAVCSLSAYVFSRFTEQKTEDVRKFVHGFGRANVSVTSSVGR